MSDERLPEVTYHTVEGLVVSFPALPMVSLTSVWTGAALLWPFIVTLNIQRRNVPSSFVSVVRPGFSILSMNLADCKLSHSCHPYLLWWKQHICPLLIPANDCTAIRRHRRRHFRYYHSLRCSVRHFAGFCFPFRLPFSFSFRCPICLPLRVRECHSVAIT